MERKVRTAPRRWFRVGPGLVIALAAAYFVWRAAPAEEHRAPLLPASSAYPAKTTGLSAPDPEWLAAKGKAFGIEDSRMQRLKRLQARWERDTRQLRSELSSASALLAASLPDRERPSPLESLKDKAAPMSALTQQLLEARSAWWREASASLTPEQRKRVEVAWSQRFTIKRGGSGS